MTEFADDNFKFENKGRKFSKKVKNIGEKGEIAPDKQFFVFQQCFQKTHNADT